MIDDCQENPVKRGLVLLGLTVKEDALFREVRY